MTFALGIDIGTSGVRSAVIDGDRLVSMARAPHPIQGPSEIDANGWWDAVARCLKAQIAALRKDGIDPDMIGGIAVDGTSGSMVVTDAQLNPVSPALMYNSKGFIAEADQIARHVSGAHITKGANSALGRAMRLVSLATAAPAHVLHQADFVAAKLMGTGGHSDYNNALKTGFDPQHEAWPNWIDQVIDPELLPQVHSPGTPIAKIAPDMARAFGLSPDTRIHAGTTDSIAAFLACAPLKPGHAVTSLGSTLAIKLLGKTRIDDPEMGLYSHRIGDLWLVGGASNTGGAVLASFFNEDELIALSQAIDPERPLGLDFYPLREPGERFPFNDPEFQPRLEPRPKDNAQFLQAMFEGMAAIEARCYAAISERGGHRPGVVYTAGGGAKNDAWMRIRALALGQTPQTPRYSDAAVGAARLVQPAC